MKIKLKLTLSFLLCFQFIWLGSYAMEVETDLLDLIPQETLDKYDLYNSQLRTNCYEKYISAENKAICDKKNEIRKNFSHDFNKLIMRVYDADQMLEDGNLIKELHPLIRAFFKNIKENFDKPFGKAREADNTLNDLRKKIKNNSGYISFISLVRIFEYAGHQSGNQLNFSRSELELLNNLSNEDKMQVITDLNWAHTIEPGKLYYVVYVYLKSMQVSKQIESFGFDKQTRSKILAKIEAHHKSAKKILSNALKMKLKLALKSDQKLLDEFEIYEQLHN